MQPATLVQELRQTLADSQAEEDPPKAFIIRISVISGVFSAILWVAIRLQRPWDTNGPVWLRSDIRFVLVFVLMGFTLVHIRIRGLTLFLKLVWILGMFLLLTWTSIGDSAHSTWHYGYVLVLDALLLVETSKDRVLLNWISVVMCSAIIVFVALHTHSLTDWGINLHPRHHEGTDPIVELALGVTVVMSNYILVRSYASDARREGDQLKHSVEIASVIAEKLANFDLDAADALLRDQTKFDSPFQEPLEKLLRNLRCYRPFLPNYLFMKVEDPGEPPPNEMVAKRMAGQSPSWPNCRAAVSKLRDRSYTLLDFHNDMQASFPELQLYFSAEKPDESGCIRTSVSSAFSSGRTGIDEYERTLGALYSVYCIARLDIDGKEVFSYGVDDDWLPLDEPQDDMAEKRQQFYENMDWGAILELFQHAGLLRVTNRDGSVLLGKGEVGKRHSILTADVIPMSRKSTKVTKAATTTTPNTPATSSTSSADFATFSKNCRDLRDSSKTNIRINEDRMAAFLVLTAIHDVMKNNKLLPVVQKRHAPYRGVAEGETILDHDHALAYVMENFPALLPSFQGLEPGQRAPVFFSQGKMGFNNGWLVQGEAPPSALFSTFKEVIVQGRACASDISFYFAHWLTDLAGAEPFCGQPWPGSVKFAAKFPMKVLGAFLESFSFIERLAASSEVEVMEEYLRDRWFSLGPPAEHIEEGCEPAAMRLALMAQGFESEVVAALLQLPREERDLIADELARTGHRAQFQNAPATLHAKPQGPALLVYYAPALIQKAGAAEAREALLILAAVYRAARELFPLQSATSSVESYAVIRIDAIKVLTPSQVRSKQFYLRRLSEFDAEAVCGAEDVATQGLAAIQVAHDGDGGEREEYPSAPGTPTASENGDAAPRRITRL